MKKFFYILLVAFVPFGCFSQAKFITKFPFRQFSGGVMVIKAQFENLPDSLSFILDTGSGGISLDSTTCAEFNLQPRQSDTTITGLGGQRKVSFLYNKTLHFPGLKVDSLNFHINNYEVLSSVYGERIDGIIGYSFFKRYIVKINFDSATIEVYSQGEIKYPRDGTLLRPAFTTIPILPMFITDRKKINFNFYFDTGAGLNMLLNETFVKDSSLLLGKRKQYPTQAEGMVGRLEMNLVVLKQVQLGKYRFKGVPTLIFNDEFNVTSYPHIGGLLGNDILRRFNLILNYSKREIHLQPNSHFRDAFDYSYTGMGVYYIDGKILIADVTPGSPAAKGGVMVDDIIVGINNNMSNNIQQYKEMLQVTNQKIKLIIDRNGELFELYVKPISILK